MDTNKRELKNKFQFSIFQFQNPHAKVAKTAKIEETTAN